MRTLKNSIIFLIIAVFIYGCGGGGGTTTTSTNPSAPTGVTATATSGQVSISWTSVSGATSYNIYWSTTTGVTKTTGTKITGATSPYTHTGLTNGTTYYYVVTAVNSYGESSESSQVSGTPAASLNFKALDLKKTVSLKTAFLKTGDSGSSMEGMQVRVEKLELKKSDGTWVTVYSGNEYLETVGTGAGTFAGALKGIMPDAGTYTGVRFTFNSFKIKEKIVSGGTTYYTTNQTVSNGSVWTLSTSSTSYDYITVTYSGTITMDFPTQLTVTAGNDVNIIFVNERGGVVSVYGNLPDTVTWAQEGNIVAAFSPGVPSKKIQFTLTASTASNIITLLLDSSGNLFGGTCYRPGVDSGEGTTAINGSFMKGGSLSAVSNSGNTATFDVSFWRGDNSINSYYQITGNYDCGTSTSGTYSSLAVTAVGGTSSGDYLTEGYTLTTTGPITCGNISQ